MLPKCLCNKGKRIFVILMQPNYLRILIFLISAPIGLFLPSLVYGGGLHIYEDTLTINGKQDYLSFSPRERLHIRYFAQDYSYSGHKGEFGYHVFFLVPKIELDDSVGRGGVNLQKDVETIQKVLSLSGNFKGAADGIVTDELIDSIYKFQRSIGLSRPDGRIDPKGKTLRFLIRSKKPKSSNSYFVVQARLYEAERNPGYFRSDSEPAFTGDFVAPQLPGKYDVLYSRVTLFTNYPLSRGQLAAHGQSEVANHFEYWEKRMGVEVVASFDIHSSAQELGQDVSVYVRVNDELPYKAKITPGVHEEPIVFSWYTKPIIPKENILFQYRIYPGQEWSQFLPSAEAKYFFLSEGQHEFQVRAKYKDRMGGTKLTPIARVSFALRDAFVSQPTKGTGGYVTPEPTPLINIDKIYNNSYALIVGITDFADSRLSPLPFAASDAHLVTEALNRHGFKVKRLIGTKTKSEILDKLGSFLSKLQQDNRVIIYFSTHGIQHPVVKSRAYLAGTDCNLDRPDDTCIPLSYLEDRLSVPLALPVKHTAVILDACASGLGVFLKSSSYRETQIALEKGAHMITAGTADQLAQGDTEEAVSYFTKYLIEGLNGNADYTGDNVISLSELLVYTRYHVAQSTNGTQTPMMGRILTPGEMIFDLTSLRGTDE